MPAIQRELREAAVRAARRLAETSLRESELRYRSVWENSTDGVLLIDLEGVIRFGNPAVKTIFGWEAEQICGKTLDFLQTATTAPGTWKAAAEAEDRRVFESLARRSDASEVEVEIGFTRMRMGQQQWLVAFIRDISQRRRHEAEIRKTRQEFAAAREINPACSPSLRLTCRDSTSPESLMPPRPRAATRSTTSHCRMVPGGSWWPMWPDTEWDPPSSWRRLDSASA